MAVGDRDLRDVVERALADGNGVLRLEPAWVARDWLPPGRRLGLKDDAYDVGHRGFICERWLASTTTADNRVGPPDEGLSYVALDEVARVTLKEAVDIAPVEVMGTTYAATHSGLGRLAKIYDFAARIGYHVHPPAALAARVGRNPKDEAYFFPPGVDMGAHPESFFGLHPSIVEGRAYDVLLPYLVDWDSDRILALARGEVLVPEEGFHLPSGVLHAPGTALTIELQEDSDAMALLQALNAGTITSKEFLFKDVSPADREAKGERAVLDFIDWDLNGDPYFYENRHLSPQPVVGDSQPGGEEHWIYYNTTKFSGKRLVVRPHQRFECRENGVYSVLVWGGTGTYAGHPVQANEPLLDELLITQPRAIQPHVVENTGADDLYIIKFFGPDINPEVPMIPRWTGPGTRRVT